MRSVDTNQLAWLRHIGREMIENLPFRRLRATFCFEERDAIVSPGDGVDAVQPFAPPMGPIIWL